MRWIAAPPELPLSQRASGSVHMRYEDVSQEGRLLPSGMPSALSAVFWRHGGGLNRQLRGSGVLPILTRLSCVSLPGPVSVHNPLTAHARHELAHCRDADGDVARLLLRVWLDLRGPRAHTHGPLPPGAGEVIDAGRLFAEHVFTRPFAPPGERQVTAMPDGSVPPQRRLWQPPHALLQPHASEVPLSLPAEAAHGRVLFGRAHTDANQHVNSLVYPRVFYEAALRALQPVASPARLTLVFSDVAFRKPCFLGDDMEVLLTAYRLGSGYTVRARLVPVAGAAAEPARAHVFAHLVFEGVPGAGGA